MVFAVWTCLAWCCNADSYWSTVYSCLLGLKIEGIGLLWLAGGLGTLMGSIGKQVPHHHYALAHHACHWTPHLVSRFHHHYVITDRCWCHHVMLVIRVDDDNHFLQKIDKIFSFFIISFLSLMYYIQIKLKPEHGLCQCISCGRSHDMFM